MWKRLNVKCPLFLSDFNATWIFGKGLKYQGTQYLLYRRWVSPWAGLGGGGGGGGGKISPPPEFGPRPDQPVASRYTDFCLFSCSHFVLYPYLFLRLDCPDCVTHTTNIHAPGGIRTHNPSNREAADRRLRPLGHWDRLTELSRPTSMYRIHASTHSPKEETIVAISGDWSIRKTCTELWSLSVKSQNMTLLSYRVTSERVQLLRATRCGTVGIQSRPPPLLCEWSSAWSYKTRNSSGEGEQACVVRGFGKRSEN